MPKCMSCHKAIVMVTVMAHCPDDYIYITPILLLWDLRTLYVVDHLWLEHSLISLMPATCNRISRAQVHELPQSYCGDNQEGTLFSWLQIYYAHLASVRFEHAVCRGSLMTTYVTLLAYLVEHSLFDWYQKCVTVHQVPRCMSCYHKNLVTSSGSQRVWGVL